MAKTTRKQWFLKNNTKRSLQIGDLPKVPPVDTGKTIDLLRYYSEDAVSQSINLKQILDMRLGTLTKKEDSSSKNLTTTEVVNQGIIFPEPYVLPSEVSTLPSQVGIINSTDPNSIDNRLRYLEGPGHITSRPTTPRIIFSEGFDTPSAWTNPGSWVLTEDTINVHVGGAGISTTKGKMSSMKATAPGGSLTTGIITKTFSSDIDLSASGNVLVLRYYLHPGEGVYSPEYFLSGGFVYLYDVTNKYYSYAFQPSTGRNHAGWNTWSVALSNYSYFSGTPDLTKIRKIGINIQCNGLTSTPSATFDLLAVIAKPEFRYLCITNDDMMQGYTPTVSGCLDLVNELNSRELTDTTRYPHGHMVGTFYCCPSAIGSTGYLTLPDAKSVYADGHAVCPHVWDPISSADFTSTLYGTEWCNPWFTIERKRRQVDAMKHWLWDHGFIGGERCLATTGGGIDWQNDWQLICEGRLDQIRSAFQQYTGSQWISSAGHSWNFDCLFEPRIVHPAIPGGPAAGWTDADYVWGLNKLVEEGGCMILYMHNNGGVAPAAYFTNFFARAQELINAGTIELLTMPQLAEITHKGYISDYPRTLPCTPKEVLWAGYNKTAWDPNPTLDPWAEIPTPNPDYNPNGLTPKELEMLSKLKSLDLVYDGTTPTTVPSAPTAVNGGTGRINFTLAAADDDNLWYAVRFTYAGPTVRYVQASPSLGTTVVWQKKLAWNTKYGGGMYVTGLTNGTTYTIDVIAANDEWGHGPTAYGASTTATPAA